MFANITKRRPDELYVKFAAHLDRLIAKSAKGLQIALQTHPWILKTLDFRIGMMQEKVVLQVSDRSLRQLNVGIVKQGGEIIGGRAEPGILKIDHKHSIVMDHQVPGMIVAMAKNARAFRKLGGELYKLLFQSGVFVRRQRDIPEPEKKMLFEIVELPQKLFRIKGQVVRRMSLLDF